MAMGLKVAITGNLQRMMDAELLAGERAVTRAIRTVTNDSKEVLRGDLAKAGFSKRLQQTIRGEVYPKTGESLGAAGFIYTRAKKILAGLDKAITIRSARGRFLTIPTETALSLIPKRTKRSQLLKAVESKVGKLQFVSNRGGRGGVLIAQNLAFSEKTGKFRKDTRKKAGGAGSASAVMFVLVPEVRTKKRTDSAKVGQKAFRRLPRLMARYWKQEGERARAR